MCAPPIPSLSTYLLSHSVIRFSSHTSSHTFCSAAREKNMRKILKSVDGINLVVCLQWADCLAGYNFVRTHTHSLTHFCTTTTKKWHQKTFSKSRREKERMLDIGTSTEHYKSFSDIKEGMLTFLFLLFHAETLNIQRINYVTSSICLQRTSIIIASHRIVYRKQCTEKNTYRKSAKLCNDEKNEKTRKKTHRNGCVSVTCHK